MTYQSGSYLSRCIKSRWCHLMRILYSPKNTELYGEKWTCALLTRQIFGTYVTWRRRITSSLASILSTFSKEKGMRGERNVCSKPERKKKQLMDYLLHGHVTPIDTCSAMHLVGKGDNAFAGIKKSDGNRAGFGWDIVFLLCLKFLDHSLTLLKSCQSDPNNM